MSIIFSYSLYGDFDRYSAPLLSLNLDKIQGNFDEKVTFKVFCDKNISTDCVRRLVAHGFEVFVKDFFSENIGGMFARYLPIFDEGEDVILVRDTDSQVTDSECALIKDWLKTDLDFHIIRSHVLHIYPIMGGLFSVRGTAKKRFKSIFMENRHAVASNAYNADQYFLAKHIYPSLRKTSFVHSVRVVFSGEQYSKISPAHGFIGETKFEDLKRDRERLLSLAQRSLIVFPQWVSRVSYMRAFRQIITFFALRNFI